MAVRATSQDSGLTVQNSRAKRLPKQELRARVLRAGSDMLREGGLTVSLHHLNMEELIRQVGVPRSSAFAAFGGKEELLTELMVQLLAPQDDAPSGFFPETARVAQASIAAHADRYLRSDGSLDPEGAHAVMREAVRVTLRQNVADTAASTQWQTFLALAASVPSLPHGRRERVTEALRAAESRFSDGMTDFYAVAFAQLGRRPRPGVQWRHVVTAGATIVEGMVSRARMGSHLTEEIVMAPGIDGEPAEWTIAALSYLALIEGLTEPID